MNVITSFSLEGKDKKNQKGRENHRLDGKANTSG